MSSRRSRGGPAYLTPHQSPEGTPRWRLAPECMGSRMAPCRSRQPQAPLPASDRPGEASHWAELSGFDELAA